MKGVTVAQPGAPYVVTSDLEKPTPGPKQILVKSLYAGLNPVYGFPYPSYLLRLSHLSLPSFHFTPWLMTPANSETFMQSTGMLVTSWPIVLGCDASGLVVETGEGITKFKKGDAVFGW